MATAYNSATTGYSSEFFTYNGESLAQVVERSIADSVGLTDDLSYYRIFRASITDTLGLTDSLVRLYSSVREIINSEGITDNLDRSVSYFRDLINNQGLTDSLDKVSQFNKNISDNLGLLDKLYRKLEIQVKLYDSQGLTDNLDRVLESNRELADDLGLTDLLNRQRIIAKYLQDNVGITDDIEYLERAIDTIISQMLEIREFKPMMLSVLQDKSQAKIVINKKPSYSSIDETVATFTSSSTLYNANITYNNSNQVYAGFDSKQSIGKTPSFIEDVKPEIISIG